MCSAAVIPSMIGIFTSVTTTSGLSSRATSRIPHLRGFADDVVAALAERFYDVHPNERLVFSNDGTALSGTRSDLFITLVHTR